MAWFKVDDGLHSSRKLLSIPRRNRLAAIGLWTIAGSWCADQLTDGHIPDYILKEWGAPPSAVEALVEAGLWERESGALAFRNWAEYQPSKRDVEAERAASRERMRELRAKRKQRKPQDSAEEGEVFGRTGANSSENVRNPDPTRPDPTYIEEALASSSSEAPKKRETRLPADWSPTAEHVKRAHEAGIDLAREAEAFRLHAETHDRHAANWNAAFTTWLKKAKPSQQPAGRKIAANDEWMYR